MSADRYSNRPRTNKGPHREIPEWIGHVYLAFSVLVLAGFAIALIWF